MLKSHLSKSSFSAAIKISGEFKGNSPVCLLLNCSRAVYDAKKNLVQSVLEFVDSHSLYSSIEYVLEHLNKTLLKKELKESFSLVLVQKEGQTLKVAGFPVSFLHYPDRSRGGFGFVTAPLQYADTNRFFSEILEIDLRISPLIRLTLEEGSESIPALRFERERIRVVFPSAVSNYVERFKRVFEPTVSARRGAHPVSFGQKFKLWAKYGIALAVTALMITFITNALSHRAAVERTASSEPWTGATQLSTTLITTITEKLPSKYVHEQASMVSAGNFLFTYQTEPNIILQIDQQAEIRPIVLDSEQIGKLTGMKKLSDELLVFTHTKSGLVFLNYEQKQWRLVKFSKPEIAEFTDIALYGDYVYVLDARSREIWKLEITDDAVSGTPWMKDSRVDLSLASTMNIDGSIYLTMITGDIVKLTQGKKDASFVLDPSLSPTLRSADAIVFPPGLDSNWMYVLDRVEKRIVKLNRSGEFIKQFKLDIPLPPEAIISGIDDEFIALVRDQIVSLKPVETQK